TAIGIYPFNRYQRVQFSAGYLHLNEEYADPNLQQSADQYQIQTYGHTLFSNGSLVPLRAEFVQETTVFRQFGPLAGNTMRLGYEVSPGVGGLLSRKTFDVDLRHYLRLGTNGLLATRFRGFKSTGDFPDFTYFGGNSELHGYDYLSFTGQNAFFADAELRFPIIEAALTPIGVIGGILGVFFVNMGGAWFSNQPTGDPCGASSYTFATRAVETCTPILGVQTNPITGQPQFDASGNALLIKGTPTTITGLRLKDGRASYGLGLETFALGFPIHFDWSWRTLLNKSWEDVLFASSGGRYDIRKADFAGGVACR